MYMGDTRESCVAGGAAAGAVGGFRAVPAAVALPAADGPQSAGFDDSTWRVVDVPHDFVVEQPPDSSLEGSHGYRARN
eukprot:gene16041-6232_t